MTTCSTVQSDSTPTRSAVVARWASISGNANGPAFAYMRPSFMPTVVAPPRGRTPAGVPPSRCAGGGLPGAPEADRADAHRPRPGRDPADPPGHAALRVRASPQRRDPAADPIGIQVERAAEVDERERPGVVVGREPGGQLGVPAARPRARS